MFTKSLIAAAAVAASLATLAPVEQASAKSKTKVDIDIGIGIGGGFYGGGYYGGGYGYGYGWGGIGCYKGKKIVEWAGFHNVHAYDCGAPVYQYKARKFGQWYKVKVNWSGNIVGVKHI